MVKALALVVVALGLCSNLFAQMIADGTKSWNVPIGSETVRCSSGGSPVLWIASYGLDDVGHTLMEQKTTILYNPRVLAGMRSDNIRLFWLGHECGHAFLRTPDESRADCWSAQTGVEQGWFAMQDADELEADLQDNPGDNNHPTGPARAAHVKDCIRAALREKDTDTHGGNTGRDGPVTKRPIGNDAFCQTIEALILDSRDDYKQIRTSPLADGAFGVTLSLPDAKQCRVFPLHNGRWNYLCSFDPKGYSNLVQELAACLDNKNGYFKGSSTDYGPGSGPSPDVKIFLDDKGLDLVLSEWNK